MNLRDLQYLVTLAELQHVGKAAATCHISQPTLSMQIKKLEEELGVMLFERQKKSLLLTTIGAQVVVSAKTILQEEKKLRDKAKASHEPFSGELKLGIFPTIAPYLLPTVVPAMMKEYPQLKPLLFEEKTDELLKGLKEGRLDCIILALPVNETDVEVIPLFNDPFLLAVPTSHPLAKRDRVGIQELQNQTLLLLEEGHCLREQSLAVCSLAGVKETDAMRATSLETLRQMVAAGVGITLMPAIAQRQGDGLAYIRFTGYGPQREIGFVYRKGFARKELAEGIAAIIRKRSAG